MMTNFMKNLLVFACLLIGLQHPQTAEAQATLTISSNPVGVIGVPVPPAAVNTAASDSLRKRPFRYGVSPEWDKNHKKPLIVIDGEIDDRQSLTIVNPQDIEKIEIEPV